MNNQYSFSEFIKTVYSLAMTRLTIPQARLIRRPVYVRGAKSLAGCKRLTTGRFCRFDLEGRKKTLWIGDDCEFGDMAHIVAHERVEIGDHALLASKVFISDTSHGNYKSGDQSYAEEPPKKRRLVTEPVKIGRNVWIGENVVVLAGARIGDGCVIGANNVVAGEILPGRMAAGTPARVIKRYDSKAGLWVTDNK